MAGKKIKNKVASDKKKPEFFDFFLVFALFIVSFASLTVAGFALHREIPALYKSVSSRTWTKTAGKISKTENATKTGSARTSLSRRVYAPRVIYTFQVENETFTGERINFAGEEKHFLLEEESRQYLDAFFPPNREVEVFYNPNDPRESTLSREYVFDSSSYQAGCICGSAGIFFGVLLWLSIRDLIKIFRKKRNENK